MKLLSIKKLVQGLLINSYKNIYKIYNVLIKA